MKVFLSVFYIPEESGGALRGYLSDRKKSASRNRLLKWICVLKKPKTMSLAFNPPGICNKGEILKTGLFKQISAV
jgi:hypothetical protein